ncbi:hypothetical protein Tco_0456071 [Tanacetum coccineum]
MINSSPFPWERFSGFGKKESIISADLIRIFLDLLIFHQLLHVLDASSEMAQAEYRAALSGHVSKPVMVKPLVSTQETFERVPTRRTPPPDYFWRLVARIRRFIAHYIGMTHSLPICNVNLRAAFNVNINILVRRWKQARIFHIPALPIIALCLDVMT